MEKFITQAILETYLKEFLEHTEVDVAICGAGPSGLLCGYYLAKSKVKVAVFERHLKVGGGMPGGGIMFNKIVFQKEVLPILDELGIDYNHYKDNLYVANSIETISALTYKAVKQGVKIFNLLSVEDVVIREKKICGVVLNWTAVEQAKLHVDPVAVLAKYVVDATGHECEVAKIVEKKLGWVSVKGEQSMWAEVGEDKLIENTKEVCPGLIVCGMAANAFFGSPRMGAIFGGMFLSGKKAAEIIIARLAK
ncbi:MAG: sulfide-dependent adenosine diphosphate thiazole synthase [Elusimicrobiota bacterium]|nr:sulfide-dependent adenosine diphosphate thiazole synthase [Elusimicrobiota bacterium]